MHRVMCDSPYQAAALLPDTESLPPGGIGGRLSKGHIDYDPFAATLDCLTQAMQARSVCTVSYRAALHRQEKTWQYAPLRLLAYRESLFVQGHMVTDDGPVERLFDDTTLLALHRITASRVTGRSSATLPAIPAPSGEGLGIREMEEEPFEVSVRFAPEAATYAANAAGAGTSVAKCMTTVPSRCLSRRITKRSVFPGCWALLTGPRCGPGLAAQGDQENGLCHGPPGPHAAQTGRHGRKRRLACRGLLPAAAGVTHDADLCASLPDVPLSGTSSWPTPFASTQVPVGPYSTLPQRLKGSWDTHAPPCRDSPFLSRVMRKKYFAASEGYGIESIGNENEFLFHNKGRTA